MEGRIEVLEKGTSKTGSTNRKRPTPPEGITV